MFLVVEQDRVVLVCEIGIESIAIGNAIWQVALTRSVHEEFDEPERERARKKERKKKQ